VNAGRLVANQVGAEQNLGRAEHLRAEDERAAVGQRVRACLLGMRRKLGVFACRVRRDVAHLFFDLSDEFALGAGAESIAGFAKKRLKLIGDIPTTTLDDEHAIPKPKRKPASDVDPSDRMREHKAFHNRNTLRHTVTAVHDNTARATARIPETRD
jgi:hypothetical protein